MHERVTGLLWLLKPKDMLMSSVSSFFNLILVLLLDFGELILLGNAVIIRRNSSINSSSGKGRRHRGLSTDSSAIILVERSIDIVVEGLRLFAEDEGEDED